MTRVQTFAVLMTLTLVAFSPLTSGAQAPAKPGPQHELLKQIEGTWDAMIKAADGSEMKGSMTAKMECGGLWLLSEFKADFGGQDFHGRGTDGYDADKKKFVSIWVDSMSTAPMIFEGDYDEAAKTFTMTGQGKGMDGKPAKFKSVSKLTDKDHHTFKMFIVGPDDKESLMETHEYSRKK